ncbi:LysR substrate-binding domain-containing protein, partial [Streptomyces synnematoformans]|uniref:LysR substrate-binding domain-containing protein n=1 Tax=Streptomyces synnematoformans TaxID=415721 RepID=UPI0031E02E45
RAAVRRTRFPGGADGADGPGGTGGTGDRLVLAVKAAAAHELLHKLLDAYAAEPGAAAVEVLPSGTCEQGDMLRDGRADVALMHTPFNSLAGFDSEELTTEGQIAVLPAAHPLAARTSLTLADVAGIPGLPLARWSHDTPGPGPVIHDQTELAQLIALDRTVAVFPESARAWLWAKHAAVPLADAPPVVTHIAWPAHSRSLALALLVRTATRL